MLDQPQHGSVKQRARPVVGRPYAGGEVGPQLHLARGEVPVSALAPDLPPMLVRRLWALRVGLQARGIGDSELLGDESRHAGRNRRWIIAQERAKQPHPAPLHREAQPVLLATLALQQPQRLGVQPEAPLQLKRRRISDEPPEPRELLLGEELDRHEAASLRARRRHGELSRTRERGLSANSCSVLPQTPRCDQAASTRSSARRGPRRNRTDHRSRPGLVSTDLARGLAPPAARSATGATNARGCGGRASRAAAGRGGCWRIRRSCRRRSRC